MGKRHNIFIAVLVALFISMICPAVVTQAEPAGDDGQIVINEENFPDVGFRTFITDNYDRDRDGKFVPSDVSWMTIQNYNVKSMQGIEYFSNLERLEMNELSSLIEVDLSNNIKLKVLNLMKSRFLKEVTLIVAWDKMYDLESVKLENVNLGVKNLDLTASKKLKSLELHSCDPLYSVDVHGCSGLGEVIVEGRIAREGGRAAGNCLERLDVRDCTALGRLDCMFEVLTNLDVTTNPTLRELVVFCNDFQGLDISKNSALQKLNCGSNPITNLDISKNFALLELECDCASLIGLDTSKNEGLNNLRVNHQVIYIPRESLKSAEIDLSKYGLFDAEKVSNLSSGELTDTGIRWKSKSKMPSTLTYTYDTSNEYKLINKSMTVTIRTDRPKAPLNLKAVSKEDVIEVSWDKDKLADGYTIYRSVDGKKYRQRGHLKAGDETKFLDRSIKGGVRFQYKVVAHAGDDDYKDYYCESVSNAVYHFQPPLMDSATSKSKSKIDVTWDKYIRADGFEIQYSQNKSFSGKKTKNVKDSSKKKATIKNLKSGKIYYVRMRCYKKVDGKKYTSSWSSKRKVKVK